MRRDGDRQRADRGDVTVFALFDVTAAQGVQDDHHDQIRPRRASADVGRQQLDQGAGAVLPCMQGSSVDLCV